MVAQTVNGNGRFTYLRIHNVHISIVYHFQIHFNIILSFSKDLADYVNVYGVVLQPTLSCY